MTPNWQAEAVETVKTVTLWRNFIASEDGRDSRFRDFVRTIPIL